MKLKTALGGVAALTAASLTLTACGGDSSGGDPALSRRLELTPVEAAGFLRPVSLRTAQAIEHDSWIIDAAGSEPPLDVREEVRCHARL
mgnify:CR=1 FL=1